MTLKIEAASAPLQELGMLTVRSGARKQFDITLSSMQKRHGTGLTLGRGKRKIPPGEKWQDSARTLDYETFHNYWPSLEFCEVSRIAKSKNGLPTNLTAGCYEIIPVFSDSRDTTMLGATP